MSNIEPTKTDDETNKAIDSAINQMFINFAIRLLDRQAKRAREDRA